MKPTNKYIKQIFFFFLVLLGIIIVTIILNPSENTPFYNLVFDGECQYNALNSSNNQQVSPFCNNNFPSYKDKRHLNLVGFTSSEVGIPVNSKTSVEKQNKRYFEIRSVDDNVNIEASYRYNEQKGLETFASNIQYISLLKNTFQARKGENITNDGIQLVGYIGTENQSISSTSSNSFLANNKLSITTDLLHNDSPMMVGGGSNPGDPGVPVGEGMWIMLIMLLIYGLKGLSSFKSTISTKVNN